MPVKVWYPPPSSAKGTHQAGRQAAARRRVPGDVPAVALPPVPRSWDGLDDNLLRSLTEIDHHDHVAYIGVAVDDPQQPGMGVARYIRLPTQPTVAEVAVTVVDRYRGRGLGTLLLGILTRSAREAGIEVFRSYVLAENTTMLRLLDELGAARTQEAPGLYRVDLALPEDPADLPDTPAGRVFREVARGSLPPFCPFHPMSWLRHLSAAQGGSQGGETRAISEPAGREAPLLREHLGRVYSEDATDRADDDTSAADGG